MRTRVKICGLTRVEDALCAAHLGVDAIGLVFYSRSTRHVSIEKALEIVNALPVFVSVVGLFVDAGQDYIREVLAGVPIDCLQFHGHEPPDYCRRYGRPYLKAIAMQENTDVLGLAGQYHDAAGLLLDTYHPGIRGGSGTGFDWRWIPRHCPLPVVLAGGLTAANVGRAVAMVRPYAVDVSSGVEAEKGVKDAAKMAAFIRNTNEATVE